MRIIGGTAGGRRLQAPRGLAVRPTPDLVKQALFNSLASRVPGARVLELFAGSGALGLECLSRGAERVTAVEKVPRHANFIRDNLRAAGLPADRLEVRTQDVFLALAQLLAAGGRFDLILADPPFGPKTGAERSCSSSQQLLDHPALPRLLAPDGRFALGHARRDVLTLPPCWIEARVLRHGDSVFRLLQAVLTPPGPIPVFGPTPATGSAIPA
jgi:16S rRNA (guanine966-N2)-methyltransferase